VGDHLRNGEVVAANLHHATALALLAALGVAVVCGAGAALESRRALSPGDGQLVHRLTAAAALAALVVVAGVGLAVAGNPVTRVEHAWHSFKGGYGEGGSDRLLSGLGSNRYDFYRVSLDEFASHPLGGIGVDNFQQPYLRHGRSSETPRYPHSVELRVLEETGVIGALLTIAGLAAALWAAMRALRGPDPLSRAVAAAALAGFGYWVVHGSVDWFWEFAGLGAPAFAMLGLVCALDPASRPSPPPVAGAGAGEAPAGPEAGARSSPSAGRGRPLLGWALGGTLAILAALCFAGPWLSQLQVESAAKQWPKDPAGAYSRLAQAASLDPLSEEPYLIAGSIALRLGQFDRADREFAKALGRVPDDAYATLERGAIASTRGRPAEARRLLERAVRLNPRDPLTREALSLVRSGRAVSVQALNRLILLKAQELA
jgi:tetratricopeptide (TPR) repeat protein